MKDMQFSIEIYTSADKVWGILWADKTFREWASIIDPETYMVGELKVGSEVQFISGANGYGVASLVEELSIGRHLLLRHHADTQENGERERENEWTGGTESYSLVEKDGVTVLSVIFDVPLEMEDYFRIAYPKALRCIKNLAEASSE